MNRLVLPLVLLLSAPFMASCNQNTLGAGTAVKNFITAPFRGIRDVISNRTYDNLVEKTEKARKDGKGRQEIIACEPEDSGIIGQNEEDQFSSLRNAVRNTYCECKAWGTCSEKDCSCDILCPDTLDILNRRPVRENSFPFNSLSFRNAYGISDKYEMTAGYCWGHASVTSKFNRLAFFKKNEQPPYDIRSSSPSEQNKAVEHYKKQIDRILDNKTADIAGFENLHDFSSHPAIQSYLGDKVAEVWAQNAMTMQGLNTVVGASPKSAKHNRQFFSDVKKKLDSYEQPQIVFTRAGSPGMTHAVLVSHYEEDAQGNLTLCIRDNNNSPTSNYACQNQMTISKKGEIEYYPYWGKIGDIKIAHNDNREAVAQVSALHEKCQEEKGCGK